MKSKLLLTSISFLLLGIISLLIENQFYGQLDQNNILQESFFLPLAYILWFISLAFFTSYLIKKLLKKYKNSRLK